MRKASALSVAVGMAACIAIVLPTTGFAGFYDGKTVDVLIPGEAGGGPAESARMFLEYMSHRLGGGAKFLVRTMPGGGGVRALNYQTEVAKPDGLTLLWGPMQLAGTLLGGAGRRYTPETFEPIGVASTTYAVIARSDLAPGLRQARDIMQARSIVIGGIGAGRTLDTFARMSFDMLGLQYRYVVGYTSQPKLSLALQGKEIDVLATGYAGFVNLYRDNLIKDGSAVALFYHSSIDLRTNEPNRVADGIYPPGTVHFLDFVKTVLGSEPAGPLAEAYRWYSAFETWPYWFITPAGTPAAALEELRSAYAAVLHDEDFRSQWRKRFNDEPSFATHETAIPILRNFRTISPAALDILRKL